MAAGVAASGFLVAAVIGGFFVVGGIVAYSIWPDDPSDAGLPAIVLEPLVLPPPPPREPPATPSEPSPAPAGTPSAVVSVAPAPTVPTSVVTPRRPALGLSREPSQTGGASRPPSGDDGASDAEPPRTGTLAPVVDAAESLTAGTAGGLRSASVELEALTAALSPDVARVVGDTVDCLADVVEGTGASLARGLRGVRDVEPPAPPPFPGARPAPEQPRCRLAPQVPDAADGDHRQPPPVDAAPPDARGG